MNSNLAFSEKCGILMGMYDLMTPKSREHLNYTLAALAIEHLAPSRDAIQLCVQVSEGKMDADATVLAILRQHGLKKVGRYK